MSFFLSQRAAELGGGGGVWPVWQLSVSVTCVHTTAFLCPAPNSVGGEGPLNSACSCHNCLGCDKLHAFLLLLFSVSSRFLLLTAQAKPAPLCEGASVIP